MAITPVIVCGYECGATIGAAGSHVQTVGGTAPTYSTTTVRTGARSLRFHPAAATSTYQLDQIIGNTNRNNVYRFYIYFASFPTADTFLLSSGVFLGTTGGVGFQVSDNTLRPMSFSPNTFGSGNFVVSLNTWYQVDVHVVSSANPWTIDVQVNGQPLTQLTKADVAANQATIFCGMTSSGSADMFWDDLIASFTGADYPIGPGHVESFVPNADGTHTSTTSDIVKGTIATPVGANVAGATDTFNWVNGRPLLGGATDNTRLINQQTVDTGYAEWQLEDHTAGAANLGPRAVDVIGADREASTATCNFQVKINDNGTESVVSNRGTVAGVITDRYYRACFANAPSTGTAWTNALFNGLRVRFGYSSDATPDVYCRGIMVEAEWPEDLPLGLIGGNPFGEMGQSQFRQLLAT